MIGVLIFIVVGAAILLALASRNKKRSAPHERLTEVFDPIEENVEAPLTETPQLSNAAEYEMSYYSGGKYKMRFNNTQPPKGFRRLVAMNCPVAGTNYYWENISSFEDGVNRSCELIREPENPYDPNAIAVFGTWVDRYGRRKHGQLGHLPAGVAKSIVQERPADLPIHAVPASIYDDGNYTELKIGIFEPDRFNEFWKNRGGVPPKLGPSVNDRVNPSD